MKKYFWIIFFIFVVLFINAQTTLKGRLERHVYTLASDSLHGREAGSEYARMASEYIIRQWKEIGIEPYMENSYLQPFNDGEYRNIIGIINGNDSVLKNEYIVIGAHYDHLGYKKQDGETIIYNGADDNASGVAILTELARKLKNDQQKLNRSIILVAFDAEEIGLVGSTYFVDNPIVPLENIKLMLSVDMVGWFKTSGEVKYSGSGTIHNGKNILLNEELIPQGLNVVAQKFETSVFTATDTQAFAMKGIPTLAVTTGLKSPYHKPEDDADLIDYDGMELITEHLKNVIKTVSQDNEYKASGKVAKKHKSQSLFTFGVSANVGSNHHYYTAGTLDGKSATTFGAGLMSQVNFGAFAIRPEVHYDRSQAQHPAGKITTDNLTIPLSFVVQSKNTSFVGMDLFLGGYYSYKLSGKQAGENIDFENTYNRNEGGFSWGFGFYMRPLKIGFTSRIGLTDFTQHPNSDKAHIRNRTNYFTLTYMF